MSGSARPGAGQQGAPAGRGGGGGGEGGGKGKNRQQRRRGGGGGGKNNNNISNNQQQQQQQHGNQGQGKSRGDQNQTQTQKKAQRRPQDDANGGGGEQGGQNKRENNTRRDRNRNANNNKGGNPNPPPSNAKGNPQNPRASADDPKKGGQRSKARSKQNNNAKHGGEKLSAQALKEKKEREERERREEQERLEREAEERERERLKREAQEKVKAYLASLEEAGHQIQGMRDLVRRRRDLRTRNLDPERPGEAQLRKLDSSVKRNTTLIKKLSKITEETKTSVSQDVSKVNQRKYVSEAAAAIGEVNFKQKDVSAVAEVCSLLHVKYEEFTQNLVAILDKVLQAPLDQGNSGVTLTKKRNTLRLMIELYLTGVHSEVAAIHAVLSDLVKEGLKGSSLANSLSLVVTFAKHAKEDLLGKPPLFPTVGLEPGEEDFQIFEKGEVGHPDEEASVSWLGSQRSRTDLDSGMEALKQEVKAQEILSPAHQAHFVDLVQEAYKIGLDELFSQCKDLRKMESDNQKTLHVKGELSESQLADYEAARKAFDGLHRNVTSLCESLEEEMPSLPKEEVTQISSEDTNVFVAKGFGVDLDQEGHAFDDDETRAFYEETPNLCAQLPTILVCSAQSFDQQSSADPGSGKAREEKAAEGGGGKEESKESGEGETLRSDQQIRLDDLLTQLQNTVNKDAADKISLEFCYLNLKSVRKRVVRELYHCPRVRLELLPYYSRIAVTLTKVHPEVGPSLCKMLEDEFQSLVAKSSLNLDETRVRNVRFLGELTKFKLLPFSSAFAVLKVLLDDFSQKSIECLAAFLETAGRFLFKTPETAVRMSNILEVMMKKKNAKNLDPGQNTLLENAYYSSRPPEKGIEKEEIPPLHKYIEHLIFKGLTPSTIPRVLRQIRKLPLQETEAREFLLKTLLDVRSVKISCISALASLISGLATHHDDITVDFVDAVLEEIQVGLEQDDYTKHQHRVSYMILLGEMCVTRLVNTKTIFNTLYMVLFNLPSSRRRRNEISDLFRARLIIVLLNACGRILNRRLTAKKLDMFLIYLQQFFLSLSYTPYELSYDIQELFQNLKPKMVQFKTFDEAGEAIAAIRKEQPDDLVVFLIKWSDKSVSEADLRAEDDRAKQEAQFSEDESEGDGPSEVEMDEDTDESASDNELNDDLDPREAEAEEASDSTESDSEDSDTDDSDDVEESDEEDQVLSIKQNLDHLKPSKEEEDILEREFQQMMQDSLGTAKLASKASSSMDLPAANRALIDKRERSGDAIRARKDPGNTVQFHVMIKRGTKAAVRDIQVPKEAKIVQANESRQAAQAKERSEIKKLVLEASEREEDVRAPRKYVLQPTMKKRSMERW